MVHHSREARLWRASMLVYMYILQPIKAQFNVHQLLVQQMSCCRMLILQLWQCTTNHQHGKVYIRKWGQNKSIWKITKSPVLQKRHGATLLAAAHPLQNANNGKDIYCNNISGVSKYGHLFLNISANMPQELSSVRCVVYNAIIIQCKLHNYTYTSIIYRYSASTYMCIYLSLMTCKDLLQSQTWHVKTTGLPNWYLLNVDYKIWMIQNDWMTM